MREKASECIGSGGGGDEFLDPYDSLELFPKWEDWCETATRIYEHIVSNGIGSAPVHLQVESPHMKKKKIIMKL